MRPYCGALSNKAVGVEDGDGLLSLRDDLLGGEGSVPGLLLSISNEIGSLESTTATLDERVQGTLLSLHIDRGTTLAGTDVAAPDVVDQLLEDRALVLETLNGIEGQERAAGRLALLGVGEDGAARGDSNGESEDRGDFGEEHDGERKEEMGGGGWTARKLYIYAGDETGATVTAVSTGVREVHQSGGCTWCSALGSGGA
ncbi:hypothetical protein BDV98DRAFT_574743 [Pterulicium gracile]|uniref:Uncharacterized protein n=1 Tax=Pterulicium gracile TaxID=1884261 RepID=A0A5C3QAG9_9AGAR|nr:hypothetical protein BDV98DRAFT_574743 [Pterula gracilis]